MPSLYDDQNEESLHRVAIEELAEEIHLPVANVKAVYENEYARLKSDAKITDYIALFASRRARETLLGRHV